MPIKTLRDITLDQILWWLRKIPSQLHGQRNTEIFKKKFYWFLQIRIHQAYSRVNLVRLSQFDRKTHLHQLIHRISNCTNIMFSKCNETTHIHTFLYTSNTQRLNTVTNKSQDLTFRMQQRWWQEKEKNISFENISTIQPNAHTTTWAYELKVKHWECVAANGRLSAHCTYNVIWMPAIIFCVSFIYFGRWWCCCYTLFSLYFLYISCCCISFEIDKKNCSMACSIFNVCLRYNFLPSKIRWVSKMI